MPSVGEAVAEDDVELLVNAMLVPGTELRIEELEESTYDEDRRDDDARLEEVEILVEVITLDDAVRLVSTIFVPIEELKM
jgi:hypothetical protein